MKENAILNNDSIEVEIINNYLPIMLNENQIKTIITDIINKHNYTNMKSIGNIMKEIKTLPTANQIDMKIVSSIIKEILTK